MIDTEKMLREMVERLPQYERAKRVIEAYIETLEKGGDFFMWAPMVDGSAGYLAPATGERCCRVVVRELKNCLREIDEHLQRVRELQGK